MNIVRSPTRSDIGRTGSHPNLSTGSAVASEVTSVTLRNKRKHAEQDDISLQLGDIQKQMANMMELLTSSISAQKESTSKITSDIAIIKSQMNDIKQGMTLTEQKITSLGSEQMEIKADIQNLASSVQLTDDKILYLENEIQTFKNSMNDSSIDSYNSILAELNDQNSRKNNIIIAGIQEAKSSDYIVRRDIDKAEVMNIIKLIDPNIPAPVKVIRIGKYKPDISRSVKVCFETEDIAKLILRNKSKVKNSTVYIFSDQTPFQQARFRKLKEELSLRTSKGEENLTIKYVKGIPQIVDKPKN